MDNSLYTCIYLVQFLVSVLLYNAKFILWKKVLHFSQRCIISGVNKRKKKKRMVHVSLELTTFALSARRSTD